MKQLLNDAECNATRFLHLFYAVGYLLLITPPQAVDLMQKQKTCQGELSRLPLVIVIIVELAIRLAILMLLAVGIESVVGDVIYESMRLDGAFLLVALLGILHSVSYYLMFGYWYDRLEHTRAMRLYRLLRNIGYAFIPGLGVVLPLMLLRYREPQWVLGDGFLLVIYGLITVVMIIVGIIEVMLTRRKPLGLGEYL